MAAPGGITIVTAVAWYGDHDYDNDPPIFDADLTWDDDDTAYKSLDGLITLTDMGTYWRLVDATDAPTYTDIYDEPVGTYDPDDPSGIYSADPSNTNNPPTGWAEVNSYTEPSDSQPSSEAASSSGVVEPPVSSGSVSSSDVVSSSLGSSEPPSEPPSSSGSSSSGSAKEGSGAAAT